MANTKILYLEADKRDFIERFLSQSQGYYLRRTDCKISTKQRMTPNPPWIYVKHLPTINCTFWHRILFDVILKKQKVPIKCQDCWKVVFEPLTLEELMVTYLVQLEMNVPSKCGTEIERANTGKLYGAYWYTRSIEEGLERYEQVLKELESGKLYEANLLGSVPISGRIGPNVKDRLILKRACTEYEQNCGPSDQWSFDEEQEELERLATECFDQDVIDFKQPDLLLAHVIKYWIHQAYKIKDPTYKKFTNGNDLFAPIVTYHHLLEEKKNGKERTGCGVGRSTELHQEQRKSDSSPNS